MIPTPAETSTATTMAASEACVGQFLYDRTRTDVVRPARIPMAPPVMQSSTASTRNCRKMWWLRAPTAMRRPISRVRSVTETSMIFMMPTPPTTSEMAATTSNKASINSEADDIVLATSVMSRMSKSLSAIGRKMVPLAEQFGDLLDGLGDLRPR